MVKLHDNGCAVVLSVLLASALLMPPGAASQSTRTTGEIEALVVAYDSSWNRRDTMYWTMLAAPSSPSPLAVPWRW
jgi:hypothetical protein